MLTRSEGQFARPTPSGRDVIYVQFRIRDIYIVVG